MSGEAPRRLQHGRRAARRTLQRPVSAGGGRTSALCTSGMAAGRCRESTEKLRTLNYVESYLGTHLPSEYRSAAKHGVIHYGTWESLVYSLSHAAELQGLRKKLYPQKLPSFKPKLQNRGVIHKQGKHWCLPFPGADNSIVYRTQRHFYDAEKKRPVQFKAYVNFGSLFTTFMTVLGGIFLYAMSMTRFTRKILLDYPRICSLGLVTRDGPKEEVMNNTKFTFELHGTGWDESVTDIDSTPPNKKVVAKVCGVNPGYGATVTALMFCALTILRESDSMPSKTIPSQCFSQNEGTEPLCWPREIQGAVHDNLNLFAETRCEWSEKTIR
ncbi:Saccharopine dehydrogenase-like oxidoreductase [Eumeta japonica]|uniref:Saccharopine dehydrogenase-like oxidoreductase n=1 Tax=Eumeta variegata TaxID=151549 RepID=A0A4C1WNK3_EUMVA|nr:Saccharopine dehydrogenase-like oxidoreductase [Eumeta japonica]